MENEIILTSLLIFLFIHIFITAGFQREIIRNRILTRGQKLFHSILIWLLPFFWFILIKPVITVEIETMTKKKRKELLKKDGGGFYESGKGFFR